MNKRSPLWAKALVILVLALFILFSVYVGSYLLSFINDPQLFRKWIASFGAYAPLAYLGITVCQILVPLIPGEPMEMIAGYAFGSLKGTLLCILAESLGSIFVLLLVKRFGRKTAEIFFEKEKIDSLSFLQSSENRILLYSLVFIAPGTPKDLLCYFAGLTDIPVAILIPLISLGRFPSIITSTLAGSSLNERNYLSALLYVVIAGVLALSGILIYRRIERKRGA